MGDVTCSFCDQPLAQLNKLITGPNNVRICDGCVAVSCDILEEESDGAWEYQKKPAADLVGKAWPEQKLWPPPPNPDARKQSGFYDFFSIFNSWKPPHPIDAEQKEVDLVHDRETPADGSQPGNDEAGPAG